MSSVVEIGNRHVAGVAAPAVVAVMRLRPKEKPEKVVKTAPSWGVFLREVTQV